MKKKLEILDTPQKNEEENNESSKKNEGNNEEFGEETEMGDVSSNLEGYLGCNDETGKNKVGKKMKVQRMLILRNSKVEKLTGLMRKMWQKI